MVQALERRFSDLASNADLRETRRAVQTVEEGLRLLGQTTASQMSQKAGAEAVRKVEGELRSVSRGLGEKLGKQAPS
jgi:hypothetical protein